MSKRQEAVAEQVKALMGTAFIFEYPDGKRGVVLKSSPRRKGFTVGLTELTEEDCMVLGEALTETLLTLISPEAAEWVDAKCKTWDGTRKDDK